MKDWIIISWYDSGYQHSISIDGKVMDRHEIEDIEDRNNPYKDIWNIFDTKTFDMKLGDCAKQIQAKYHKNVLVCEDGGIEFYEITQK